jgi:hypothetical protein
MMRRLSASGVNGKMFNTDSFKQQMAGLGADDGDDEGPGGDDSGEQAAAEQGEL